MLARRLAHQRAQLCMLRPQSLQYSSDAPEQSSTSKALLTDELKELLFRPSWSINSLQTPDNGRQITEPVTRGQLHHLLRLSALPMPATADAEAQMLATLHSQLRFVQAVQKVDTNGVTPLAAIRDETNTPRDEHTVTLDKLREEFGKEEQIGVLRRVIRKQDTAPCASLEVGAWDPLESAPSTKGRYISISSTGFKGG